VVKYAVLCGGSALAVAASLCASSAFAATDNATTDATQPGVVGELTVVAEKRVEAIESVPVAITAFSPKQREILGIRTVQDLSDFTPGLSYYAVADRAYIRGIGRNTVNLATAAGVAVYYNGIYYGANGSISLQHDSLFIGNVEVDRGPQNTLHGSNADGGVIDYQSKKPTDSFYAEGRVGIANDGYYYGEAVVSGPINDDWKFRIGGNYSTQDGGYFHNFDGKPEGGSGPQGNGGNWQYFEAQLQGKIGDHLDVWAMASSGEFDTNFHTVASIGAIPETPALAGTDPLTPSDFYGLCALNGNTGPGCMATGTVGSVVPGSAVGLPVLASQFTGNNPSTANPHNFIETSVQHNTENDNIALATNWTYHLPGLDITYLGGFQSFFYHLTFGPGVDSGLLSYQIEGPPGTGNATIFPAANTTLFIEKDQSFSNEVDFTSTTDDPLQYLAGLYEFHEHFNQPIGAFCEPNQGQLAAPFIALGPSDTPIGLAAANPDSCAFNQDGDITYDDYAAFGHFSYKFNDQWNIAGGVRFTGDHRAGWETARAIDFAGNGGAWSGPGPAQSGSFAVDITGSTFFDASVLTSPPPKGAGPASLLANGDIYRTLSASWSALTGDMTINWTPDPTTLTYFRYARGYKAGGFAAGTFEGNAAIGTTAYTAPEYVDSFELGLKKTIGQQFQVNGALFYYNFQNDQQPLGVSTGGVVLTQLFNIPAVREYGLELEGVWKPIDPLTFNLEYSYLNSRVTSMTVNGKLDCVVDPEDPFAANPGAPGANIPCAANNTATAHPQDLVGSELPEAPPNKVTVNGQYVFNFEPGNLTLSASYIWKDQTYGSIFNRPLNLAPSYSNVNLRATWDSADKRYTIVAFVSNLFSSLGYDNVTETRIGGAASAASPVPLELQGVGLVAPRTSGLEFQPGVPVPVPVTLAALAPRRAGRVGSRPRWASQG
jgi:iron complex outermembrane recepter protein